MICGGSLTPIDLEAKNSNATIKINLLIMKPSSGNLYALRMVYTNEPKNG